MRDAAPTPPDELPRVVDELRRLLGDRERAEPALARRRLRALLTVREPGTLPGEAWPLLDGLFAAEARTRPRTVARELPRLGAHGWAARASLWRGDLTTLDVDVIVNAANSGLTGCYQPFHACVDNAIHSAAGPWLREDCGRIMSARGRPEPTATATLTEAGHLPARFVAHTVGPIVAGGEPTAHDARLLARCYTECLEAAREAGAAGCAFCSISTGVFGYAIAKAAPVAIGAVRGFLEAHPAFEQAVFVCYSASDEAVYAAAVREALRAQPAS
jgi:O-acetyl-ADP-ribose deacetylase (regulator of RNase III)